MAAPSADAFMPSQFVGEIRAFAGNYPPNGWALCNGQLLPISQNTALFSLIGTTYGGNGTSNFALPDLRGRVPIQQGQGPGLVFRDLGESGGAETHALLPSEIPLHSHSEGASAANGAADGPGGGVMARSPAAIAQYGPTADGNLSAEAVATSGNDLPHNNLQPYLTVTYIIALQGIFPQHP
jgi:microcystin-dependent protein